MVKIKPLDKKETSKIKTKLFLLIFLIFLGLIFSFFFKGKKPPNSYQKKTKEEVLGEKIEINKKNNFDEIFAQVEKYRDDLKNQINNQIREVEKLTSESISSFIYDTTIKPIINQIQKLPKDQQERVKKEICQ